MRWTARIALVSLLATAGCLGSPSHDASIDSGADPDADGAPGGRDANPGETDADPTCLPAAFFPDFSDDFQSGTFAWGLEGHSGAGPDADIGLIGGALDFMPHQTSPEYAWVQTPDGYDFTDLRVSFHVLQILSDKSPTTRMYFSLIDPGAGDERMFLQDGQMHAVGAAPDYDNEANAWWQIRGLDDTIHFETSPDGMTWVELAQITPSTFDMTDDRVEIGVEVESDTLSSPGHFRIDDLNLPPDRCP